MGRVPTTLIATPPNHPLPQNLNSFSHTSIMYSEKASPLFLGLDLSTQQLKAVIMTEDTSVIHESTVNFAKDLPQYGTTNAVIIGSRPGEVTSPVAMWVHALDLLVERAQASGVDASMVVAISGASQVCLQTCASK